jgi:hypothetical protein
MTVKPQSSVPVTKDSESEQPVPKVWRPALDLIVKSIASRDYSMLCTVPGIAPIDAKTIRQIEDYVEDYGAKLVALPEAAWETSVCIWMGGRWSVMVDLWTESEGRSDLVMKTSVYEREAGFTFEVDMVFVP